MNLLEQMNTITENLNVVGNKEEKETIKTIPSYEVAEMMEVEHAKVLRMIEGDKTHIGIIPTLDKAQMGSISYFIKSSYKDSMNRKKVCYECTKLGCDMLANKMTGEKGVLFTAKYVKRFSEMEEIIKNPFSGLSKELQAIFTIDKKQQQIEQNVNEVKQDLKNFKDNAPLFNIECDTLQKALRGKVIKELGGKNSLAYKDKSIRTKIYIDAQNQLKREFAVQSYKAIKRCQLEDALEVINTYKVPTVYKDLIDAVNRQILLENVVI